MGLQINRETIKAFILNELSGEMLSIVSDAILTDERVAKIFEEEKFKIDIKRYHDNEMTPAQRLEFEKTLIKDTGYSVEVKKNEKKNSSSEELPLRRKLDKAHSTYKTSQKQHYSTNRRLKYWLVAASITVVLIVGGGIAYYSEPSDSLENRLYAEYYTPLGYMDGYVPSNNFFTIAKQKYVEGDYTNALLLLQDLPSFITIESEKNLYIGLSLMEVGEFKAATGYFEKILDSQSKLEFTLRVRWYLGLCYLKLGDRTKAVEAFQAIVDRNDYNYKKAKRILRKLRG